MDTAGITDKEVASQWGDTEGQARTQDRLRHGGGENKAKRESQATEKLRHRRKSMCLSQLTWAQKAPEDRRACSAHPELPLSAHRLLPSPPVPAEPLPSARTSLTGLGLALRRPRMAKLTSRGALCGPPPARGFLNTEAMATLWGEDAGLALGPRAACPGLSGPRERVRGGALALAGPAASASASRARRPAGGVPAAPPARAGEEGRGRGVPAAGPPRAPPTPCEGRGDPCGARSPCSPPAGRPTAALGLAGWELSPPRAAPPRTRRERARAERGGTG